MRLIDYFPESSISIKSAAKDWQEAIDFSMSSLLQNHYINANYIEAIKTSTLTNGLITFSLRVWQCLMPVRSAVP